MVWGQVNVLIFKAINANIIVDEIFFCFRTSTKIVIS